MRKYFCYITGRHASRFSLICVTIYALITFTGIVNHEPWRDEAQAWLIARDLSLSEMFRQMAYEGTPGLWHLLIFPLAKLGFPYIAQSIIHWLLAIAAVYIFINYAPFSKILKVLFVFSYYMFFEYVIIARNYNLSLLLLFAMAAVHHKRYEQPLVYAGLIFGLFNANLFSFGAAAAMAVLYITDRKGSLIEKKYLFSLLIIAIGAFFAVWQLSGGANAMVYQPNGIYLLQTAIQQVTVPIYGFADALLPVEKASGLPATLLWIVVSLFFVLPLLRKTQVLFFLIAAYGSISLIFMCVYTGHFRHHGFYLMFLLMAYWLAHYYQDNRWVRLSNRASLINLLHKSRNMYHYCIFMLGVFLLISWVKTANSYLDEYRYNFSGAEEIAHYIKVNNLQDRIIVGYDATKASAILPYFPGKKLWYPEFGNYQSYITWDKQFKENADILSAKDAIAQAKEIGDSADVYILFSNNVILDEDDLQQLELFYANKIPVFWAQDEVYSLYKLKK